MKKSQWWWVSYTDDAGRVRRSLKPLGLSADLYSKEDATEIAFGQLGLLPEAPDPGAETLSWFRALVLRRLELENKRASTTKEYRIALDHMLNALGAEFPLRDVTRGHWARIREHLASNGNAPSTINKTGRHLHRAFQILVDDEVLDRNPLHKFARITVEKKDRAMSRDDLRRFLVTTEQEGRLVAGAKAAQLIALTGRRLTEILMLRRSEVDLQHNRILVMNAKHRDRRKKWIPLLKSVRFDHEGEAYVFSPADIISWLLDQNDREDFLSICHADTLSHWIKGWLRDAELGQYRPHDLRHTWTTLAGESMDLWKVQQLLDHSSIVVTEGYFHLSADDITDADLGLDNKKTADPEEPADNSAHV